MTWLSFFASIIGSVAWPTAVVIVILTFRKSLARLIPDLQRLKYKDLELEFSRTLAIVKQELGEPSPAEPELPPAAPQSPPLGPQKPPPVLPPHPPFPSSQPDLVFSYFKTLAEVSPRAAILEAWLSFELAAHAALEAAGLAPRGRQLQMPKLFDLLRQAGLVDDSEVMALRNLRELRNRVVHGPEPNLSNDVIAEYGSIIQRITDNLQRRLNKRQSHNGVE